MGRSQVKYNRTHGRPGAKGRGAGRGRAAESRPPPQPNQPQPHQGDSNNAWRYQEASAVMPSTEVDLQLLDLEVQKLPQYSEKVENEDGQQLFKEINVSSMGKALDHLSVAQRLSIPAYLTVNLEVKCSGTSKDDKAKYNVTLKTPDTRQTPEKGDLAGTQPSDENAEGNEDDDSAGKEDDLDAWLDSVIT